jgi:NAD(P)-dependent dehydrogenase (short-subunit alcohol dehydrogenase family)
MRAITQQATLAVTAGARADESYTASRRRIRPAQGAPMSEPEDIAAAALFLASDESTSVTGGEIFADGGLAQV